jgi:spermidine synthase
MNRAPLVLLYLNVLVIATCGLIYELLAGTLASYVLGDSVTQFSLVIGVYLSALGVGAWLSSFVAERVARVFVEVELGVALLGGLSAPLLFFGFAHLTWFRPMLFGVVFLIGLLVGLELPLLMRILREHLDFSDLVARVLAFDYIGALAAAVLFPIFLVPTLGLIRTSLLFGTMNAAVGLWGTFILRPLLQQRELAGLRGRAMFTIILLVAGIIKADALTTLAEEDIYPHTVVYSESSRFQRIVFTRNETGFQLYLNGHLQFNSADEYRYHEALVHPAMSAAASRRHVLILGGGDGLAVREVLRYGDVEHITLVDLDPAMTRLGREFAPLVDCNSRSLHDARVTIINDDAFLWVGRASPAAADVVLIDFPDPNSFTLGKLYTSRFYQQLRQHLHERSVMAIQCTSPLMAPRSYWCIINTLEAARYHVSPYHAPVPSFGVWGYALASPSVITAPPMLPPDIAPELRYLTDDTLATLFDIPVDLRRIPTEVNRLDSQMLVRYYEQEWSRWE